MDIIIWYLSTWYDRLKLHHLRTYLLGYVGGRGGGLKTLQPTSNEQLRKQAYYSVSFWCWNQMVWICLNDAILEMGRKILIDVGFWNFHQCHNAFAKCLEAYRRHASELVIELQQWFKLSSESQVNYQKVQEPVGLNSLNKLNATGLV